MGVLTARLRTALGMRTHAKTALARPHNGRTRILKALLYTYQKFVNTLARRVSGLINLQLLRARIVRLKGAGAVGAAIQKWNFIIIL